jgi:hypothetical protein
VSGFLNATENRWGNHFLGVYYGDELGGKMLDDPPTLTEYRGEWTSISFLPSGEIRVYETSHYFMGVNDTEQYNVITTYQPNGTIIVEHSPPDDTVIYQPDGTTTLHKLDGSTSIVTNYGNISQFEPYQQLWETRPIKNYDDVADYFIEKDLTPPTGTQQSKTVKRLLQIMVYTV